ncbi:ribonucleotide-diphosphate reductase subunit beta, partial [Klebsiella aerogenes]
GYKYQKGLEIVSAAKREELKNFAFDLLMDLVMGKTEATADDDWDF